MRPMPMMTITTISMTLEDFSSQSQYVSDADSDGPREITCVPIASQFRTAAIGQRN